MFDKLQIEIMKKAAKIDGGKQCLTRTAENFPYNYGKTRTGDVIIMNRYAVHVIPESLVYINLKTVFRSKHPMKSESVTRILDDSAAENATMTNDLVQLNDRAEMVHRSTQGVKTN